VLRALLADEHVSRPPDVRDDLAQTVGVRGSDAGDIEPLLKRDAARKYSVARWVHALVLSSHRRELSRQLIIHATDGTSPREISERNVSVAGEPERYFRPAGHCRVRRTDAAAHRWVLSRR
jgi:hypothetical protein